MQLWFTALLMNGWMLAVTPRSPLWACALDQINENVGNRRTTFGAWTRDVMWLRRDNNPKLMITGPEMLAECLDGSMNANFLWHYIDGGHSSGYGFSGIGAHDGTPTFKSQLAVMHMLLPRQTKQYSAMVDFSRPETIYGPA